MGLRHFRHRGHEVVVFHVLDPREIDLEFGNETRFFDLEAPDQILRDVETGLTRLDKSSPEEFGRREASYTVLTSRREAIERAIEIAGPEDTVVLAGKGHEDYQIIGTKKFPFDDRLEARRALNERGGR